MRVLHWYPNLMNGGGVANAVLGLARAQAEEGVEVILFAASKKDGRMETRSGFPGASPRLMVWKPAWTLGIGTITLRGLRLSDRTALGNIRPDIVHVHGEFNLDNLRVASVLSCPRVISPHGAFHPLVLKKNAVLKALYLALGKRILYRGAVFHALSPLEKRDIERLLPQAEVYVTPNGPSLPFEKFTVSRREPRGTSVDPIRFFYAGRLDVYRKGLDVLLDAFAEAFENTGIREARLILAGRDHDGGELVLKRKARELGIEERVDFLGPLDENKLSRAYLQADICLQVSRNEAFSISAAEALLFGKPIIMSAEVGLGSYPEIRSQRHVTIAPPGAAGLACAMRDVADNLQPMTKAAWDSLPEMRNALSWKRAAVLSLGAYGRLLEFKRRTGA